ncbi:MAG: hypothetical protein RIE77_03310 [Phycisphaerales bacterium]
MSTLRRLFDRLYKIELAETTHTLEAFFGHATGVDRVLLLTDGEPMLGREDIVG